MKKNACAGLFFLVLILTSCVNTKKMVYLENMREDISYPMNAQVDMKIQRDDRLGIVVNSRNPELAAPFNISTGGGFQVTDEGEVAATNAPKQEKGYRVDLNGYIELPILGKMKVVDLTRKEVGDMIRERLISENLISDPVGVCGYPEFQDYCNGGCRKPDRVAGGGQPDHFAGSHQPCRRLVGECDDGQGGGNQGRK